MKKIIVGLVCSTFLYSCNQSGFTVTGKIDNMPVQKFRLEQITPTTTVPVDSGSTKEDGTFTMNGDNAETSLYRMRFEKGKYIMLALDKGKANISGDWLKMEDITVTGSEPSQSLQNFLTALRKHIQNVNTLDAMTKNISTTANKDSVMTEIQKELKDMNHNFALYVKQYGDTSSYVPNAVFAANLINPAVDGDYLNKFYSGLETRFPKSQMAKDFTNLYKQKMGNMPATSNTNTAPVTTPTSSANPAPDFTMPTPDGQSLTLSSLRGKYVLIDFWASWCAPCRAENPNVVAVYNTFKNKNFTILGVSFDKEKQNWVDAIAKDHLTWQHVSELKGWETVVTRLYNISGIPTNVLVDPAGNIIAKDLRGDALKSKLAEVLK